MSPAVAAICAIAFLPVGVPASAQNPIGPGPRRVLALHQVSWWAADGLPAAEVVARDTALVLRFDSARGWPASGIVPAELELEPGARLQFSMTVRSSGIQEVMVSAEEARCGESYAESPSSGLAPLALALVTPADSVGEDERTLPTLTYAACDDTVQTAFTRTVELYQPDSAPGRSAFLSLEGSIGGAWRIERHLTPGGTLVRGALRGNLSGRVRLTARGVADSVDLSGEFRGPLVYQTPSANADTVYGTWVVHLTGDWREDPAIGAARRLTFFIEHGRNPEAGAEEEVAPSPYASLVARAQSDSSALDTLVALRLAATDPGTRADIEAALFAARGETPGRLTSRLLRTETRIAPDLVLQEFRYPEGDSAFGLEAARYLARELGPLALQRRRLTDREDLGAGVLSMLRVGHGFVREAGPVLQAAARRADDPVSRDLLWFAAYQADPARYRRSLESSVDSVRGYGPIALAWVAGNGAPTLQSWGVEPSELDTLRRFPGVDAAPDSLAAFLEQATSAGVRHLAPLRMRFESEGRDLGQELRRRFASDTTFRGREVVARYLDRMDDTTARPWLRGLLQRPASMRELAYELLPPDTVRDTALIADVQRLLLGYLAGRVGLRDTAGKDVPAPWVHDERPDLRILASDGILPSAIEPWRRLFMVIPMDSVRARVALDGLQMAWVVSHLKRLGDRYYVSVTLVPIGGPCLSGAVSSSCSSGVEVTGSSSTWNAGFHRAASARAPARGQPE